MHDRNHKPCNIASTEICDNNDRIDVDNLERGSVDHLTDPAIYRCLERTRMEVKYPVI
jgi:hypothetical protein